jgi:hypothetical protein
LVARASSEAWWFGLNAKTPRTRRGAKGDDGVEVITVLHRLIFAPELSKNSLLDRPKPQI